MAESEESAVAAALSYVGEPVTFEVLVDAVQPDAPAEGVLRHGDGPIEINGDRRCTDYRERAAGHERCGRRATTVTIEVAQGNADVVTETVTTEAEPGRRRARLPGCARSASGSPAPSRSTWHLDERRGTQCRVDLQPRHRRLPDPGPAQRRSRAIAGTGTISPRGEVGPIGGIVQKMYGAREDGAKLFLAPRSNCARGRRQRARRLGRRCRADAGRRRESARR